MCDMNHPDNNLPAETPQQILFERRHWCRRITRITCLGIDILSTLLLVGGYLLLRFTDTVYPIHIDVTKLCNDSSYNVFPRPNPSSRYADVSFYTVFIGCLALTMLKKRNETGSNTEMIKQGLWEFWIILSNVINHYIIIELLKCAAGIPRPYFFSDEEIKNCFCDLHPQQISLNMKEIDLLRKSFPSHRAATSVFIVVFAYLYVGHYDINIGLHSTQTIVLTCMGAPIYFFLCCSVRDGENHFSDILVGAIIGGLFALVTIHCIFGKIFHSQTAIPNRHSVLPDYDPQLVPEGAHLAPAVQTNVHNRNQHQQRVPNDERQHFNAHEMQERRMYTGAKIVRTNNNGNTANRVDSSV